MESITIPLNSGRFSTIIDAADLPLTAGRTWYATCNNHAASPRWYVVANCEGKTVFLHRLVFGDDNAEMVDHIDNDTFNNRRSNLRAVTRAENGWNRKFDAGNTSGYRGVIWNGQRGKWSARITTNGRQFYGGSYDDPRDAAIAADRLIRETRGPFAVTNFHDYESLLC